MFFPFGLSTISHVLWAKTCNKVCKLKKALYGLKQSPRAWFGRFAKVMKESGYKQSQGDHNLFIKHLVARGVTALLV